MYPDSEIGVYTDLPTPEPRQLCVGTLRFYHRSHSSAGFEYSREWLSHPCAYELEPGLPLTSGAHYTRKPLFGCMGDSVPDRWGGDSLNELTAKARQVLGRGKVHCTSRITCWG